MAAPGAPAALQLLHEFQQVQSQRAELYASLSAGFRDFLAHGQQGLFARQLHETTPGFAAASKQVIAIEAQLRSDAVGRPDLAALLRQVQELERRKLQMTLSWQALRTAHAAGKFSWQDESDRPCLRGGSSSSSSGVEQQRKQQQQQQQLLGLMERVQQREQQREQQRRSDVQGGSDQGPQQQPQPQSDGYVSVKPGFYEQQMQQAMAAAVAAAANGNGADSSNGHANGNDSAPPQQQEQQQHHHHHGCCGGHGHGPRDSLDGGAGGLEPTEAEYGAAVREALQELDGCVASINELLQEVREAAAELAEEQA